MADHFIYILVSKNAPKTYIGVTSDIEKRISEHNSGSNAYTRKYKPWKLFYSEKFDDRSVALKREIYLKSHAGRNFIKKLFQNIPR
ncbi:MAG: GIY-YIG nuclease family protein [Patescibacteria group bacterium]